MKTACLICVILTLASLLRAESNWEQRLEKELQKLTADELPGMAVLVARDGKIIYQGAFGYADLSKKNPVTTETKFRIGSVTKQFVAAAILRLVDDGEITLDDRLETFFPGFANGDKITIHQLLTHISGIHSYTSKPDFLSRVVKPIEPMELISWFRDDKPDFAPGNGFLYNNSAYFLLGEIIAKVSQKSLDAYLQETFFIPLGMKDTGIFVNATPPPGVALGYSMVEGKAEPALDWDMSWAGGAGALYSTVGDLYKWNDALFGGKILRPKSFQQMTTPVTLPAGVDGMSYGYGLVISPMHRLPAASHSGGLNGWSSQLMRITEQNCTIVALANALPPVESHAPGLVADRITEQFLAAEIKARPLPKENTKVNQSNYTDYAGRYDYKTAVLTVTVENGRLMGQLTGQEKYQIYPSDIDEFFWKITDASVAFLRDENGKVIGARHTQGGSSFRAMRLVESEVKLTKAQLDAILGEYDYGNGAKLTVTHDGENVFAQLTSQPKLPIFPKSPTEYEWRIVPATIKFTADQDGKITGAIHSQGGATINAPKIK